MDEKTVLLDKIRELQSQLVEAKKGATNSNFVQVDKTHIDALNELASHAPSASKLLWNICKAMDKQNAVMVSQESLIRMTGLSKATIKRSIALLREQCWIEVLKCGTANIYRVNSAVFWQDRADGKWAAFSSAIILNWEEQDKITKASPQPKLRHIPFVRAGDEVVVPDANKVMPPPDQPQLDFHSDER